MNTPLSASSVARARLGSASVVATFVALLASCGGAGFASALVRTPDLAAATGQTRCGVQKSQAKPLIVEWPSPDRLDLESKLRKGLVVVRYVGCEMSVLSRCSVPARYAYEGTTRDQDQLEVKDEDELYANLPVGAAKLEGKLQRSGRLTVEMSLVGRFEAERATVSADDLQGECEGATHFVYSATVGAFDFYAGGKAAVSAGAGVGGLGGGVASQAERETLTRAGDESACAKATSADRAPPEGCGALIRIEVAPLGPAMSVAAAPSAPSSTWSPPSSQLGYRASQPSVPLWAVSIPSPPSLAAPQWPVPVAPAPRATTPAPPTSVGARLAWQRAESEMTWAEAKAYCESLPGGVWRLPARDEIFAAIDSGLRDDGGLWWSSSRVQGSPVMAWYVAVGGGISDYGDGSALHRVRCVR
jgi:hypothetical protein